MRVHAVETGKAYIREFQAVGKEPWRRLRAGVGQGRWTEIPVRAWLIEHPQGLIVVDTGLNAAVSDRGFLPRWQLYYRRAFHAALTSEEELGPQLRALGFDPVDIRWTVLTHLHLDHDGGLQHVLRSEIVVSKTEYGLARGLAGRARGYLPHRWPDGFAPRAIEMPEQPYGPFRRSFQLAEGVILVATPGHTAGHVSVIVEGEPRLFIAGDACYSQRALEHDEIDGLATDAKQARLTLARIRALTAERETIVLPTHDPEAPARLPRQRDQHRRFVPRVVQEAERDAVEPEQRSGSEGPRRP